MSSAGRWTVFVYTLEGGAFTNVAVALAKGLWLNGTRVDMVHLGSPIVRDRDNLPPGTRTFYIRGPARTSMFAFARHLRRQRPEVLVSLGWLLNGPAVLATQLARTGTTCLLSEHSVLSYKAGVEHRDQWLLNRATTVARYLYPLADGMVAVSTDVSNDLTKTVGIKGPKTTVIPNPVDVDAVRLAAEEESETPLPTASRDPLFISLGRLARQKDPDFLVDAFAEFVRRRNAGRLLIAGGGPLASAVEAKVAELGLSHRISMLGSIRNPFPLLKRCDALVLTSEEEGFGLVLVEAMAVGTPVVVRDSPGGVRDVLLNGGAGLLVERDGVSAFVDAMERIVDDPETRARLVEAGTSRAEDFSPKLVARQWLQFAKSVSV